MIRCLRLFDNKSATTLWHPCYAKRFLLVERSSPEEIQAVQVQSKLQDIVRAQYKWGSADHSAKPRALLPDSQTALPARRMTDSYQEAIIPFSSRPDIRKKYVNRLDTLRYGRLMEDLDSMGWWIAIRHHVGPDLTKECDFAIVTAVVDSIQMKPDIRPYTDMLLRGHPTWVGQTSLEVTMNVDQVIDGVWQTMMVAKFLMVTSDPFGHRKAYLCPLQVVTSAERALIAVGEATKTRRRQVREESLLRTPPTNEERQHIHSLFITTLDKTSATFKHPVKPEGSVWMEDTILKNVHICFPEDRNLYNKAFGGFLMRQAFELSWASAGLYCQARPIVVSVDDILFREPVEVGAYLFMSSEVVYTQGPYMQLRVHAEVVDRYTGAHKTTNIFHYTYRTRSGNDVPEVMPKSYAEYMMFVDGKRHFKAGQKKIDKGF